MCSREVIEVLCALDKDAFVFVLVLIFCTLNGGFSAGKGIAMVYTVYLIFEVYLD